MTDLCEGGNEPPGSLKAIYTLMTFETDTSVAQAVDVCECLSEAGLGRGCGRPYQFGLIIWLRFLPRFSPIRSKLSALELEAWDTFVLLSTRCLDDIRESDAGDRPSCFSVDRGKSIHRQLPHKPYGLEIHALKCYIGNSKDFTPVYFWLLQITDEIIEFLFIGVTMIEGQITTRGMVYGVEG
ncbi:hypothetical protein ANN_04822 [Periplaneta americana]|uniref:Uncharacterized protein n=1 Tax=Periplaneta americana TaxID=6978 RepID=A0ABQ8T9E4_PERAM|nr:hypothetical protein ANN_04822 [Periplaneta americana]